ncbi:putative protein kinase RLK-Pelle-LRR-XI-1 family [Medicago truncatula]|uniref:Protein kinase domain-containing protein n=1 Tax=Medicago truncatula TaxID=3880 RepID=A0A396J8Q0_MEDTR|nr:probable leucine-rich repeat receptor-like protein kinase At5g63930 isoform X2 [Medicago truncatula]RHN72808.1 putative protein kinase RLK-Pelle-LRR-XI-1 family [Medicago truncatula]
MEIFKFFYFINLLSTFILSSSSSLAIDPYSQALLSLKSELIDNDNSLHDWVVPSGGNLAKSGSSYACSWSGIKCNKDSNVTSIDLSMKKLGGVLSGKQLSVFTEVIDFNLSNNLFSGKLPPEIFNLTNLKSLDIDTNNFSGQFPKGISKLKSLVVFDAWENNFSGQLPAEFSELENLKILNLYGNSFSGSIPSEYGSFRSLESLLLAANSLTGSIPPELGNLKTVTSMEIGSNSYQGFIPPQLGNMSQLQNLEIADANLSGSIPKELFSLTNLQILFLSINQLTGSIPSEFSKIKLLTFLDLSDNLLSGSIPESFSELKSLIILSLGSNDMSGIVPEGIAELPSLEFLLISHNRFSGSLPKSLGKNSKLKSVDVSVNNFNGSIPPSICQATQLSYFSVSYNMQLGGNIPSQIWSMPQLQNFSAYSCGILGNLPSFESCKSISTIRLGRNNLSGTIPKSVSKCQALMIIELSDNNLTGQIPEELADIPILESVDLSNNKLNGLIPEKFGSSSSLKLLNVSFNNISGSIPEELADIPILESVDLSNNKLNGLIPEKFGSSSSIKLLNVSFNNISGSIPKGKSFKLMDTSAFVGNSELCGVPLRPCIKSVGILGSTNTWKLTHILLLSVGLLIILMVLGFGILHFKKGFESRWKMISFVGLPQFTPNDVLTSFNVVAAEHTEVTKAVLPTGITVLVKKIEWETRSIKLVSEFIMRLGNAARHKNLIRLLGFCYNQQLVYLLYDYLPNGNLAEKIGMEWDWSGKFRTIVGIARGLCFLHHECYPAIPHGDLNSTNVVFDEDMEPHLAEFGFKHVIELSKGSSPTTTKQETEYNESMEEELGSDVYNFGKMILEILTGRRLTSAAANIHSKSHETLLREVYNDNEVTSASSMEEIKLVLEVAMLCTRSRSSDRPSMEDALKLLSVKNF